MDSEATILKEDASKRYYAKYAEYLASEPNEMISIPKSILKRDKYLQYKMLPAYIQTYWNKIAAMPGTDYAWNTRVYLYEKVGVKYQEEDIKEHIGKTRFKAAKFKKEAKEEALKALLDAKEERRVAAFRQQQRALDMTFVDPVHTGYNPTFR